MLTIYVYIITNLQIKNNNLSHKTPSNEPSPSLIIANSPPICRSVNSSDSQESSNTNSFYSAQSCGKGTHSLQSSLNSLLENVEVSEEQKLFFEEKIIVKELKSCSSTSSCCCSSNCGNCCCKRTTTIVSSSCSTEETLKQRNTDTRIVSPSVPPTPTKQESPPLFVQTSRLELDRLNAISSTKACACEECILARQREQHERGITESNIQPMPGSSSSGGRATAAGSGGLATNYGASTSIGPSSSSGQLPLCNGPTGTQTIEEQIKQIDRITKECDNSRKSLEAINRRLDDLTDEMRRYREFLGHEKTRRVPALYKTTNAEPLSVYNESICRLIDSLTSQLTLEWTEKLRSIQNQTIARFPNEKG
ncbi:unnamed protein product [Meloidogyne enterolobii]|uniref:Uncharacterized protein n=1 Tax=Meloidogyne enterolobii TaxID=390850 RepID=A0ACB0XLH6_MELEN